MSVTHVSDVFVEVVLYNVIRKRKHIGRTVLYLFVYFLFCRLRPCPKVNRVVNYIRPVGGGGGAMGANAPPPPPRAKNVRLDRAIRHQR